jgi:hypothetical protein
VSVPSSTWSTAVSIVQCETIERIAYFHLELDMFHNAVEFAVLYPGEDCAELGLLRAAPRRRPESRGGAAGSPCVPASRSRLARCKAGSTLRRQAWSGAGPAMPRISDMPVPVEVVVDGVVLVSSHATGSTKRRYAAASPRPSSSAAVMRAN